MTKYICTARTIGSRKNKRRIKSSYDEASVLPWWFIFLCSVSSWIWYCILVIIYPFYFLFSLIYSLYIIKGLIYSSNYGEILLWFCLKIVYLIFHMINIPINIVIYNYYCDPLLISLLNQIGDYYVWLYLVLYHKCKHFFKLAIYTYLDIKKLHIKIYDMDIQFQFWYYSKTTVYDLILYIQTEMNNLQYDGDYLITHPDFDFNNFNLFDKLICNTKLDTLRGVLIFLSYNKDEHEKFTNKDLIGEQIKSFSLNKCRLNHEAKVSNINQCQKNDSIRYFSKDTQISGIYDTMSHKKHLRHQNKIDSKLIDYSSADNLKHFDSNFSIKLQIYGINIIHFYQYQYNNTIGDLHIYCQILLQKYGINEKYKLLHSNKCNQFSSQFTILNNTKKFHITFQELQYQNNNVLYIIPESYLEAILGGGGFGNAKPKFAAKTKRARFATKSYWQKNGHLYNNNKKKKRKINKLTQHHKNDKKNISKQKRNLRNRRYHQKLGPLHNAFRFDMEKFDENNSLYSEHDAGGMDKKCGKCNAWMFADESLVSRKDTYALCCQNGRVILPKLNKVPDKLFDLLTKNTKHGKFFRANIRKINAAFAFASFGCNKDKNAHLELGDWGNLKINGNIYHQIDQCFTDTNEPKFASIYFYSGSDAEELSNRVNFAHVDDSKICREVFQMLQDIIHELNPFYKNFKNAIDLQREKPLTSFQIILKATTTPNGQHKGCYNLPVCLEQVAAIIPGYDMEHKHRDIILYCKNDKKKKHKDETDKKEYTKDVKIDIKSKCSSKDWFDKAKNKKQKVFINEGHVMYDPATYVLMFPQGRYGWGPNCYLKNGKELSDPNITENQNHLKDVYGYVNGVDADHDTKSRATGCYVNCRKYYKYFMMIRDKSYAVLHRFGKLWQQKIIDDWCKVEANDLTFYIKDKQRFRFAYANQLLDAIVKDTVETAGSALYLGPAFVCGPRWYHNKYQDAMTIVQNYKKPDLFITFTTNRNWKEITSNLLPNQTIADRPDLIARVFQIKKQAFLHDLTKNHVLGKVDAHVHTIEFQKRRLPHIHILLILSKDDSITTAADIDSVTCAELPDRKKYPKLFEIVVKHMIHFHKNCLEKGVCSKHYPKNFQKCTSVIEDGYPLYKRRHPENVKSLSLFSLNYFIFLNMYSFLLFDSFIAREVLMLIIKNLLIQIYYKSQINILFHIIHVYYSSIIVILMLKYVVQFMQSNTFTNTFTKVLIALCPKLIKKNAKKIKMKSKITLILAVLDPLKLLIVCLNFLCMVEILLYNR